VNHLEGHIYSPYLAKEGPATPLPERFLSLVISGGHSALYDVRGAEVRQINRTRDDAIGETFDKVAKFIGLPYPGGPEIEKHARRGTADPKRFPFPLPRFTEASLDFSYSGIKAGAIRLAREHAIRADGDQQAIADFAATFQDALFAQLFDRIEAVWAGLEDPKPSEVAMAGGVAANGVLRERIAAWGSERGLTIRIPEKRYCTDNAAMIAFAGLQKGTAIDPRRVVARSRIG
jgi:N6-L-threonylcarbamoyladenine synthase